MWLSGAPRTVAGALSSVLFQDFPLMHGLCKVSCSTIPICDYQAKTSVRLKRRKCFFPSARAIDGIVFPCFRKKTPYTVNDFTYLH